MKTRPWLLIALAGQVLVVACASSLDLSPGGLPEQISVASGRTAVTVRWSAPPGSATGVKILAGLSPDLSRVPPVTATGGECTLTEPAKQTIFVQLVTPAGEASPIFQALPQDIYPVDVITPFQYITGAAPQIGFAESLAVVGDVDGDGVVDLVVGAPETSGGRGAIYLFRGGSPFPMEPPEIFLGDPGTQGHFGSTIAAGDFDGDGHADVVVGAPDEACAAGPTCGKLFLLRGVAGAPYLAPIFSQTGSGPGARLGAVTAAGEALGNGLSNLAVVDGQVLRAFPGQRQAPFGFGPPLPPVPLGGPLYGVSSGASLAIGAVGQSVELAVGLPHFTVNTAEVVFSGGGNLAPFSALIQPPGAALELRSLGVVQGTGEWLTLDGAPGGAQVTRRRGTDFHPTGWSVPISTTGSTPAFRDNRFAVPIEGGVLMGDPYAVVNGFRTGQVVYFAAPGSPQAKVIGTAGAFFGVPVVLPGARIGQTLDVGDLNGDGLPDVVATAPGVSTPAISGVFGFVPGLPGAGPSVSAGGPLHALAGEALSPVGFGFLDPVHGIGHDCRWTWGDGAVETYSGCLPASPSHVYRASGIYRPVLRVTAADGRFGEASTTIYVRSGP